MDKQRRIAVFDFDNTLTVKDSLPLFLRFVAQKRGLSLAKQIPAWVASLIAYKMGRVDASRAKAQMLFRVLKGLRAKQIAELGADFAPLIERIHCQSAIQTLQAHRKAGHYTVLLSASIAPALSTWAEMQAFDLLIATELAYDEQGFVLDRFDGANCKGEEKLRRLLAEVPDFYEYISYGYGDARSDRYILEACTHAYYKQFPDEDFLQD